MPEPGPQEPRFNPDDYKYGDSFSSNEIKRYENEAGRERLEDEDVLRYLGENPCAGLVRKLRGEDKTWSEISASLNSAIASYLKKLKSEEFGEDEDAEDVRGDINALREAVRIVDGAAKATYVNVEGEMKNIEKGPSSKTRMYEQIKELKESGNKLAGPVLEGLALAFSREDSPQKARKEQEAGKEQKEQEMRKGQRVRKDIDELMSQYVERYKNEFGLQRVLNDEREVRAVLNRWLPLNPD